MTDLESRLRELADLDPGLVDAEHLTSRARELSTRRRRLVAGATTLVLVILAGLVLTTLLIGANLRAATPANHRLVQVAPTDDALCTAATSQYTPPFDGPQLSPSYQAVALCPADPADPAWAELPKPSVVHEQPLDAVQAITGAATPCRVVGRAQQGFRLVLVTQTGVIYSMKSADLPCAGAIAAQSFSGVMAWQAYNTAAKAGSTCSSPGPGFDPPHRFTKVAAVRVCASAYPFHEIETGPLRYRPILEVPLSRSEQAAVVDGLAKATITGAQYDQCPWRRVFLVVNVRDVNGTWTSALLGCGTDPRQSQSWATLPPAGQAVLQRVTDAYLAGRQR